MTGKEEQTTKIIISNRPYTKDSKAFFIVPNDLGLLMTKLKLKPNDRLVYMCLLRFANNSGNPYPSYKKIKEYTGIASDNTVSASIKRLEQVGLICKVHQGKAEGDSNVYQVNYVYIYSEVQQEAIGSPQKAFKGSGNINTLKKKEKAIIPFKRGYHDSIVTSKEAEDNLKEYEANKEAYAGTDEARINAFFDAL